MSDTVKVTLKWRVEHAWLAASVRGRGHGLSVDVDIDKVRAGDVRSVLEQLRTIGQSWLEQQADAEAVHVEAPLYLNLAKGEEIRGKLAYFAVAGARDGR